MKKNDLHWLFLFLGLGLFLAPENLFALDPSKSLLQYNCRRWTRQNALPANAIRSIAQTDDGYLWLGTQKGLLRFDGDEFSLIKQPQRPEWRSHDVRVAVGIGEHVWFGLDGGSGGYYDAHSQTFWSMSSNSWISSQKVGAILQASDGATWIGADSGILRLGGRTNETITNTNITNIRCLFEDTRHRVWIGTTDEGLFYWEAGRFKSFPDTNLPSQIIFSVTVDATGHIWVGTPVGLRCYDSTFQRHDPFLLFTEVRALLTDRSGTLWIGTSGDGLLRYQGENTPSSLTKTNGLANDFVTSLLEDKEGNLWVGTREGLSLLNDVRFPIYTDSEGWAGGACIGVCSSGKGGIWTATAHAITRFDGTNASIIVPETAGMTSHYCKRVFEARDGDLYTIDGSRDIDILSGGHVVAKYPNTAWPTAFAEDNKGVVVSVAGNLFRVGRTQMVPFTYRDKAPPFYWIRNLSSAPDGSLLVATVNGAFRINDDLVEHWSTAQGLSESEAMSINEDDDDSIWVGQMSGLSRIRNNEVRPIHYDLLNTVIMAIVPDDRGNLWLDTHRGIIRVNRASLNAFADGKSDTIDATLYDGLDSVKSIDTTEIEYIGCKSTDGCIWFPTPQGAVKIDPAGAVTNPVPPAVHIQKVFVNGVDAGSNTVIHPGNGELSFQYIGISFYAPQKVQYRYRLEGYDSDWIEAGSRRNAVYTNLKPKHYIFTVQACNADGVWNLSGDRYEVDLPPHYYQTAWFRVLIGLAVLTLLAGAYTWRVTHLRHKELHLRALNEQLETSIRERTRELAEQRNLLRTLIDNLPDEIFVKDTGGKVVIDNLAHARTLGIAGPEDAVGKTDFDCFNADHAEHSRQAEKNIVQTGFEYNEEEYVILKNGKSRWQHTTKVPLHDSQGRIIGIAGIHRDITDRKKWEAELESLHKQLVLASRHAGMAEVATSVLHNVGNVLNSVNVSASLVEDHVRNSAINRFKPMLELLRKNETDLAAFFTQKDRSGKFVHFMEALEETLKNEQAEVQKELQSLVRNIEHIKKIVSMQQSYASVAGLIEAVHPADLVEDALRMHEAAFQRHSVKLIREFSEVPSIEIDRHKVIQILVNLFHNAKYACEANGETNRFIHARIRQSGSDRVRIEVQDNGTGIHADNLKRIFSHGFTTRKNGHGFGLHSGALAAAEMGGSLVAESEGSGKGALFILELPVNQRTAAPRKEK